nr:unnamed protein product [Callosobruchus chinensis]
MSESRPNAEPNPSKHNRKPSKDHVLRKRQPNKPERGDNVLYISTKTNIKAHMEKCNKLISNENEIIIYCLGAAIQRGILLALQICEQHEQKLTQSFATHNHTSSIRCVATADHYVASGSADDRLMIYDMKKRKEHCMLTHHNATVNAVQFTANGSHVLSGSADGVLSIIKTGNWKLEKIWDKAHKGDPILDIAVHPTGKLALSLGQDYALRTWNLVKGRQAYAINLSTKSKDFRSLEKIYSAIESFNAHDSRVKSIVKYSNYVITASSNGEIKVWSEDLEELAKTSSGCRITCLCILPVVEIKKEEEDSEADEEFEVVNADKGRSRVVIEVEDEGGRVKKTNKKKKKKKLDQNQDELQHKHAKNGKKSWQKNTSIDNDQVEDLNVESTDTNTVVKKKKDKKKKHSLGDLDVLEVNGGFDDVNCVKNRKRKKDSIEPITDGTKVADKKKKSASQQNVVDSVRRKKK